MSTGHSLTLAPAIGGIVRTCLTISVVLLSSSATADPVTDWNLRAGKAAVAACISPADDPLHESRLYAMMHVAIHDALNAIDRRSRPYAYDAQVEPSTSPDAAVAAAARAVLVTVIGQIGAPFPPACPQAGIASAEADYAAALAAIPDGAAKTDGIAVGRAAAAAILALRSNDGSDTPLIVQDCPVEPTPAGEYRCNPLLGFVFAPGWGTVAPFVMNKPSQFRSRPPDDVSSHRYAADLNEIKALGGDDVTTPSNRTAEQTEIGLFWIESSPLAWNRLARDVSAGEGLNSWENARLFGLLNLAMADGYIGSWETKFHYRFWRPETAIRAADTDGNPDTVADPTWTPLQLTYPMPDYDSAHSTEGGAAAQVLEDFFKTDTIPFTACSLSLPAGSRCTDPSPVLRSFASFSEAANENAYSRILIGIHFRKAVEEGVEHGRQIGKRAVDLFMRPVR
jgi:VCPO second helical-bundle domain